MTFNLQILSPEKRTFLRLIISAENWINYQRQQCVWKEEDISSGDNKKAHDGQNERQLECLKPLER